MKLQIASDLHLERVLPRHPHCRLVRHDASADALLLLGDIGVGVQGIEAFKDWPVPVFYVAGNHEFYGRDINDTEKALRLAARGTSVTFLEKDEQVFQGVRFLGTTMWTNYKGRRGATQRESMEHARLRLADHYHIREEPFGLFTPEHALNRHKESYAWLKQKLSLPFEGPTVVMTHHAPHRLSVHPQYQGDPLNAAFVSDLSDLLSMSDYHFHGHCHNSFKYSVRGCQVGANPSGYLLNWNSALNVDQFVLENTEFNPSQIVEI